MKVSKNHFGQLEFYIPDLKKFKILDVGSGRGKFLVGAALAGATAVGLEIYPPNIELTKERARAQGVKVDVKEGVAESLPFPSFSFDFVNLSEVVEHVENPVVVMKEAYRVLNSGGHCYVSIPSRFAIFDPHFHLWFINWLPRVLAERYIVFRGKEKDYSRNNGKQRLSEMHYYTFGKAKRMLENIGFTVNDMRALKLRRRGWYGRIFLPIYVLMRPFYFNAFHFLLEKK
jgi:SAM-dependent methyltransferase